MKKIYICSDGTRFYLEAIGWKLRLKTKNGKVIEVR